jgi:hypothetical protein
MRRWHVDPANGEKQCARMPTDKRPNTTREGLSPLAAW